MQERKQSRPTVTTDKAAGMENNQLHLVIRDAE